MHRDLDQWRRQWAAPEEEMVLYVGRHVFEKGVDLLLAAAPKVLAHRPQAKFIIAGDGPCHNELKRQAWELGLGEKVLFPGYVDDLTRNSLYHLADAAVFPSRYEPFGLVALEAMAGGAPVIVSDVGGFAETVRHEVNGLTFYAGNANSLADCIIRLLNDKPLARRLVERAALGAGGEVRLETDCPKDCGKLPADPAPAGSRGALRPLPAHSGGTEERGQCP